MTLKSLLLARQTALLLLSLTSLRGVAQTGMIYDTATTRPVNSPTATSKTARTIPARKAVSEGMTRDSQRTGVMGASEQAA